MQLHASVLSELSASESTCSTQDMGIANPELEARIFRTESNVARDTSYGPYAK